MSTEEYETEVARKLLVIKQKYIEGKYKEEPSETVQIVPPQGYGPDDWIAGGKEEQEDVHEGPLDMQAFRQFTLEQKLAYARKNAIEGIDIVICVMCHGSGDVGPYMCDFCQGLGILWGRHNP